MKTNKPTYKTVDKWTKSPEEIFRKHGLTLKWGNKAGSLIFPAQGIRQKDNNRNNETTFYSEEFPTSNGTRE